MLITAFLSHRVMYPHLQPLCPFPEPWSELRCPRTHQSSWGTPGDPIGVFRRGHSPACRAQADCGAQKLCSTALLSSCHSRRSSHSNGQGSLPGAVFTLCVTGVTPVGMYTHTPREGNRVAPKTKKSTLCQSPTSARKLPSCPLQSAERDGAAVPAREPLTAAHLPGSFLKECFLSNRRKCVP